MWTAYGDVLCDTVMIWLCIWLECILRMAYVQPLYCPFIYLIGSDMIWFYGLILESIWYRCVEIDMVVAVICCVAIDR